jgi:penicillin amidase
MSVTASLPELRSGRKPVVKIIFIAGLVLLLAILAAAAWFYWIARSALPKLDGTVAVPGLSAKVRVVRDGHGIPTIEAASLDDLFFAQGYVTAQDRLWQMDAMRRAAAGELAEILGPDLVKFDREQRILGLRAATADTEKAMSARDRAYFEAYARGVNAFIDSHRNKLSLEFRLLKYSPKPWTVADSLLVGARMVQDLNHYSYARALTREKVLAKLGPELTADLYVNSSWRDRPPAASRPRMDEGEPAISSDEDDNDDDEGEPVGEDSRLISKFSAAEDELFRAGSNNWVVSGQHTVTGKPLLSNDMHLDHQMPNLWFAASEERQLRSGRSDFAGNAFRDRRTQSAYWLGIYQCRANRGRRICRGVQRQRTIQDSSRMARSAAPAGRHPRERPAGCDSRRGDHTSRTDHHGAGPGRNPQDSVALDSLRRHDPPVLRRELGAELG